MQNFKCKSLFSDTDIMAYRLILAIKLLLSCALISIVLKSCSEYHNVNQLDHVMFNTDTASNRNTTVYERRQIHMDKGSDTQEVPSERTPVQTPAVAIPQVTLHYLSNITIESGKHRRTIQECCKAKHTLFEDSKYVSNIPDEAYLETNHAILYCGIPKVGSTFWGNILEMLHGDGQVVPPYQKAPNRRHLPRFESIKPRVPRQKLQSILDKSVSFMFVRNPYERLFSGYTDKLYHPNGYYMNRMGIRIVRRVRAHPSDYSRRHGHDVTFVEFVRYILFESERKAKIDWHFSPMHQQCNMCKVRYDYIGKMESFAQDAMYLLNVWREKYRNITIPDHLDASMPKSIAKDYIHELYLIMKRLKQFPAHLFMLRTWRIMQIRGFLSKDIPFPYSEAEAKTVKENQYMEEIGRALDKSGNKLVVKLQRKEALIQAYQTLPLDLMERIRNYVLLDCLSFGYDDRPEVLFNRYNTTHNAMLYLDGIQSQST